MKEVRNAFVKGERTCVSTKSSIPTGNHSMIPTWSSGNTSCSTGKWRATSPSMSLRRPAASRARPSCASRRSSASTASASSRPFSRWKSRRHRATARTCSRTSVIFTSRRGRRSSSATSTARAALCTRPTASLPMLRATCRPTSCRSSSACSSTTTSSSTTSRPARSSTPYSRP